MKLQFKEQDFQVQGVKAVVDCFQGQPIKTNRFTLERSKEIIRKTKLVASGVTQVSAFEDEVLKILAIVIQPFRSLNHKS